MLVADHLPPPTVSLLSLFPRRPSIWIVCAGVINCCSSCGVVVCVIVLGINEMAVDEGRARLFVSDATTTLGRLLEPGCVTTFFSVLIVSPVGCVVVVAAMPAIMGDIFIIAVCCCGIIWGDRPLPPLPRFSWRKSLNDQVSTLFWSPLPLRLSTAKINGKSEAGN